MVVDVDEDVDRTDVVDAVVVERIDVAAEKICASDSVGVASVIGSVDAVDTVGADSVVMVEFRDAADPLAVVSKPRAAGSFSRRTPGPARDQPAPTMRRTAASANRNAQRRSRSPPSRQRPGESASPNP